MSEFRNYPWYRKIAMVLLSPVVFLCIPIVLLFFGAIGLFAVTANFLSERWFKWQMKKSGRFLKFSKVRIRIASSKGTLIIESPTLGWGITRAWWTEDDVQARSPFPVIVSPKDRPRIAEDWKPLDWDKWCWEEYIDPKNGSAKLVKVWNGESIEGKLKRIFPELPVVSTWTALVTLRRDIAGPRPDADLTDIKT